MTVKTSTHPPVEKVSSVDQFSAFTGRDFRTATIENHWVSTQLRSSIWRICTLANESVSNMELCKLP
jgi:hypothetical protein